MTADTHSFPAPIAYDTPILEPRPERERTFSPRARRLAFWSSFGASTTAALAFVARKNRAVAVGVAAASGALALARWQGARLFANDAYYVVERHAGPIEIRRYAKQMVAETDVEADDFRAAVDEGFGLLIRYLRESHLAMTVPVLAARSDRRDWTTMRLRPNAKFVRSGPGRFTIRFVLPASAPQSSDGRVHVREIPEHRIASMRFTGRLVPENIEKAELALDEAMTHALLTGRGEHIVAAYDPPTTLPFARRNEIWLKLA